MATVTYNTAMPLGGSPYERELKKIYGQNGEGVQIPAIQQPGANRVPGYGNAGMGSMPGGFGGPMSGGTTSMQQPSVSEEPGVKDYINEMYDSSLESQKQQLQSNYEMDVSNLDAEKEQAQLEHEEDLSRAYVEAYKKAKNFNEVQNAYGLTSGAMGQAALAQGNQLSADLTELRAAQEQIDAEIERQRSILAKEYSSAIAQAQADNDFQRAQALYEQAQREEDRLFELKQAAGQLLAEKGDFSILGELYGLTDEQIMRLSMRNNASSGKGAGTVSYATWKANLSNSDRKALEAAGEI